MPRRCAFGCAPSKIPMHRFPDAAKFPEHFKTWVKLVGGRLETSSDFEYYKTKRICDIHFSDKHRNRNQRLSALAVPMLHLPGQSQTQVTSEKLPTSTHLKPTKMQQDVSEPSQSHINIERASASHYQLPSISQLVATGQSKSQVILEQLSTSIYLKRAGIQQDISDASQNFAPLSHMMLEHNYSAVGKPERTDWTDLTAPLCRKIEHLQTNIKKGRLKSVQDLSSNTMNQNFAENFKKPQLLLSMQLQAWEQNGVFSRTLVCQGAEHCKQLVEIMLLLNNVLIVLMIALHRPDNNKYERPDKRHSPLHKLFIYIGGKQN